MREPHVRFDERDLETEQLLLLPRQISTLLQVLHCSIPTSTRLTHHPKGPLCMLRSPINMRIAMSTSVVCVHGIGQQVSGEDSILSNWVPALRDGNRHANGEPPPAESIGMAFYGDLFRKKGTKSLGIPPYDESDVTEEWEKQLLEA